MAGSGLPIQLDTHELAWAVGFFDGEGSTILNRKKGAQTPTIVLTVSLTPV